MLAEMESHCNVGAAQSPSSVIVSVPLEPPQEFDALTGHENTPKTVGVPEMTPVDVLIERPEGRLVAVNEVGLFVAVSVNEKKTPFLPVAVVGEVRTEPEPVIVTETFFVPVPQPFVAETVIVQPGQ